ncbi:MAG: MBL fold metallo-hydrolase [Acidimicrobiia bacterium]
MDIRLIVLGSGQDGGTPQFGSPGAVGSDRSASSVALVVSDGPVLLFDASPDIRSQARLLPTRGPDDQPVDAVFVTHAHMGHYAGLLHFGKEAAATSNIPLFAPDSVVTFLEANEPWATLFNDGHLESFPLDHGTATVEDIEVQAIPVPHRPDFSSTCAFTVSVQGDPWILYVPDIDSWDLWPEASTELARHPVCLIDATFSDQAELPRRDFSDFPHPLVWDTINRFAEIATTTRLILTHINHSNALGDPDSAIALQAKSRGFEVAVDGMEIVHGDST